jgi:DNA-directed RNA polymerase specialized sigma24 family protein
MLVERWTAPQYNLFIACSVETPTKARKQILTIRTRLKRYFEYRNAASPEEMASETIFRALNQISRGKDVPNLDSFCYGIAANIVKEGWKRRPEGELRDDMVAPGSGSPGRLSGTEQSVLLAECLRTLSGAERDLLRQYYWDDRKEVAVRIGVSPTALRIRVFRILEKVRANVGAPAPGGAEE